MVKYKNAGKEWIISIDCISFSFYLLNKITLASIIFQKDFTAPGNFLAWDYRYNPWNGKYLDFIGTPKHPRKEWRSMRKTFEFMVVFQTPETLFCPKKPRLIFRPQGKIFESQEMYIEAQGNILSARKLFKTQGRFMFLKDDQRSSIARKDQGIFF